MRSKFTITVLVLAIVAMLGVSVASATHVDSSPNGCSLCFVAHTVAFETPAAHIVFGTVIVGRTTVAAAMPEYQARAGQTSFSRGPPSFM